jgi:hypothetical protein
MTGSRTKPRTRTSTSFAFLQSEQPQVLADSPEPTGSSPGLFFPTAHIRSEGPLVWPHSKRPWFRLQGLITLLTVYSLRIPAGVRASRSAPGIFPFQASALQSAAAFSQQRPHLLFHPHLMTQTSPRHGDAGRSFWDSNLAARPVSGHRHYSRARATGGLPGVRLSRVYRYASLESPFGDHPPACSGDAGFRQHRPAPRSFNRLAPGSVRIARKGFANSATLLRFAHHSGPRH